MLAAMCVVRTTPCPETAVRRISDAAFAAARADARLALFGEAVLTGLANDDRPGHDLPLGVGVPGPELDELARAARAARIWLALGVLERDGKRLFDSALLLAPDGRLRARYRRIDPHWHGRKADPGIYGHGTEAIVCQTDFGRCAFAICGDLFEDRICAAIGALRPELVLVPFARSFEDFTPDRARWDAQELPAYAARAKALGAPFLGCGTLTVDDGRHVSIGGAMAVTAGGKVLDSMPPGVEGNLLVEVGRLRSAGARI